MNVSQLFPAKSTRSRKKLPGGLTPEQARQIEADFAKLLVGIEEKATQYFRSFMVNQKQRFWLLPISETAIEDLPLEKKQYVLRYGTYFRNEISKQVLDEIPYG